MLHLYHCIARFTIYEQQSSPWEVLPLNGGALADVSWVTVTWTRAEVNPALLFDIQLQNSDTKLHVCSHYSKQTAL